ncbi:MAG TPA: AraC family transcriptional regulator [Vicinamibacterales bacterium]|nr:AraC family transcriptional regulator [Vicinamibacterales bacterium]
MTVADISITTWTSEERILSTEEVDGTFERARGRLQVFAFETRRMQVGAHSGSFSVKTALSGREHYEIDGQALVLEPGAVLLVNAGERYSSAIDGATTTAVSWFLPDEVARRIPEIVPIPFRPAPMLAEQRRCVLQALACGEHSDAVTVAQLVHEVTALAVNESLARFRPGVLPRIARRRTRRDLIARVSRARDYLEDHHGCNTDLDVLADVACLSKYHLLRTFAAVFGVTPAIYAQQRRLRHARQLLREGVDIKKAARLAGYASVSTLGRALRRTGQGFGASSETGGAASDLSCTSV